MNLQTYKEQRKKSEVWTGGADEKVCMLCLGLAGESGEIVDYFKKILFHKHHFDKDKLIKELGDLIWYLIGLIDFFNIDLEEVFDKNIEKLNKRYPNGWNTKDSIKRIDEAEFLNNYEFHIEKIECPECHSIQEAKVYHTLPFYMYAHICNKCGYQILESEWREKKDAE